MKFYKACFAVALINLSLVGCQDNQRDILGQAVAIGSQEEPQTASLSAEKQPEQTNAEQIPDDSSKSIEPADLIGIWSWVGNPSQGKFDTSHYKYNLMTFHPEGRISRSSALDPDYYDGMTQFMAGNGKWESRNGKVATGYQIVTARDTTRIIHQYPGVEVIPGVATTQVREKYHLFELDGEHLVREDGSRYERISSDSEADGKQALKQAVDNKNYRNRHMIEQYKKIYSPEYGY